EARHAVGDAKLPAGVLWVACVWLCLSLLFSGTVIAVALVWPLVVVLLFPHTLGDRRRLVAVVSAAVAVFVLYGALQMAARLLYATPDMQAPLLGWLIARPRTALIAFLQLIRVGVTSLVVAAWWTATPQSELVSW